MTEEENDNKKLAPVNSGGLLSKEEFRHLAEVPPEMEWFANISNKNTRRAYQNDLRGFMEFVGINRPEEFRRVTRSHAIAWRGSLEKQQVAGATIRRKLAALSSLFEYLCESNAVTHNPVKGVKRPKVETYEGSTPALGDHQVRKLLTAVAGDSLKAKRDRAILSVFLYHGLRREELCTLKVKDITTRRGVLHLSVHGKGGKIRFLPLHPATTELITEYVVALGNQATPASPLFRPVRNNVYNGELSKAITTDGVYRMVRSYYEKCGIPLDENMGVHPLRATAATNALDNEADLARVQQWLGHANIATTKIYDKRKTRPEDSPTFKVAY